jgi:hypothetical protein
MVRSVISNVFIWCVMLSVVLLYAAQYYQYCFYMVRSIISSVLYGASCYQLCCDMVRSVISSVLIWCVNLSVLFYMVRSVIRCAAI